MDYKAIFEALPNVEVLYITDDGHFHLDNVLGCKKVVTRTEINEPVAIDTPKKNKK